MKKILLTFLILLMLIAVISQFLLRIPLWHLGAAVDVATGLGAKLACSGRYLSGFKPQQVMQDLAAYSPANRMLEITYDDQHKRVSVNLLGLGQTSAKYRPGLGCSLELGDSSGLDKVVVPQGNRSAENWPAGDGAQDILPEYQTVIDQLLAEDNQQGLDTRALLLIKNGKLVAESYASGYSARTPLLGWSMGKSLTAILIGHLEYQEQLTPEQSGLFPAWLSDKRASITVENMLQMTSGLDFDETYAPGSDATHMLFAAHSASDVALQSALVHPPSKHFSYSSGTTNLLARLLVDTLGGAQQAVNYLYQNVFFPLGMHDSVFEPDASGVFVGSSYIYATARDWARLGQLILNQGQLNGHRLLSEDWVKRATQANSSENDPRYGYQFWLNRGGDRALRWAGLPADAFAMSGNRSQRVMIIPSRDTVIVRLGWTTGRYPINERFSRIVAMMAE